MERWVEGKLIADTEDIAYEPQDKEGKKLAAALTLYLNLLMWRVKMDRREHITPWDMANNPPNCRCVIRPITPQK